MEMSIFSREDPYGWHFRAEHYFDMYEVPERDKVSAASMCMEGRALNWLGQTNFQDSFVGW
ncbi:hypothetical protein L484_021717 [Morus notabilis]|uniref:Uncharacterized protein n=1 Tax=Morus notabilis TaxID=981085 RepID=W9S6U9_9ROSA|nr:hypothetical protein L484_021717 [Morus notabilis]